MLNHRYNWFHTNICKGLLCWNTQDPEYFNNLVFWYFGILISPENPSSMASLLGIESLDDLLIFLSLIWLAYYKNHKKCLSLQTTRNNYERIGWEDFLNNIGLDEAHFTPFKVNHISKTRQHWLGIGQDLNNLKPTPGSQFNLSDAPPQFENAKMEEMRLNIKNAIKYMKSSILQSIPSPSPSSIPLSTSLNNEDFNQSSKKSSKKPFKQPSEQPSQKSSSSSPDHSFIKHALMNIIDQIDKNTNITVKIKGNELIIKVPLQTTCNNTKPTISNIFNNSDNKSKTTTHSQIMI